MHARPARCVMHVVFGMHGPAHGGAVWAGGHCATAKRHWRGAGWGRQSCEREQHPAQRTVHGLLVLIDASCRWSPRMPPGRCPPSSSLCLQERLHHQVAWLRARTVIRAHSPAYNGITWSLLHLAAVQHSALRTPRRRAHRDLLPLLTHLLRLRPGPGHALSSPRKREGQIAYCSAATNDLNSRPYHYCISLRHSLTPEGVRTCRVVVVTPGRWRRGSEDEPSRHSLVPPRTNNELTHWSPTMWPHVRHECGSAATGAARVKRVDPAPPGG